MGSTTLAQSVAASLVWESVNKNTHTPTSTCKRKTSILTPIRRENLKSAICVLSACHALVSRAAGRPGPSLTRSRPATHVRFHVLHPGENKSPSGRIKAK